MQKLALQRNFQSRYNISSQKIILKSVSSGL